MSEIYVPKKSVARMRPGLAMLIEAFQIFQKYEEHLNHYNKSYPTACQDDTLNVMLNPAWVSVADIKRLAELSFEVDTDNPCFYSNRFGSC